MFASQAQAQAPAPPKLLIAIAVDQLSADLFDEYRPQFTGGLARLYRCAGFRKRRRKRCFGNAPDDRVHHPSQHARDVAAARHDLQFHVNAVVALLQP